jgi:hypothetical protein
MRAEELVACVLEAHATLHRESDLSPRNPRIGAALCALVAGVMAGSSRGDARRVLEHRAVGAVRSGLLEKLAVAEGLMERHWAETFCPRAGLAVADLRDFVYWDCYCHLVGGELRCLPRGLAFAEGETIAFVGAGALPLSAIFMHVRTGLPVTCIDADPRACRLARALCDRLGLAGISVRCADGAACDYALCPVVFVASLVSQKADVVARVLEGCPHAVVALRSAEGLATLLYEPVDEAGLEAMGCECLGRTEHDPRVVNTTLFYRAAPAFQARAVRGCLEMRGACSAVVPE